MPPETDDDLPVRDEPVAAVLAELTGRPQEAFEVDEADYEIPAIDDLEVVEDVD